jgi:hypothetical protein
LLKYRGSFGNLPAIAMIFIPKELTEAGKILAKMWFIHIKLIPITVATIWKAYHLFLIFPSRN